MALGTTVVLGTGFTGQATLPGSVTSGWTTAIDAGGMDTLDDATLDSPDTQITDSTRHLIQKPKRGGTIIRLRMGYDRTTTAITTDPTINVFGRVQGSGASGWQALRNEDGNIDVAMTTDPPNDTDDGSTFQFTVPSRTAHSWDTDGNDEFLVGTTVILAGITGGNINLAFLQVKII